MLHHREVIVAKMPDRTARGPALPNVHCSKANVARHVVPPRPPAIQHLSPSSITVLQTTFLTTVYSLLRNCGARFSKKACRPSCDSLDM